MDSIKELLSKVKIKSTRVPTGREGTIFLYRDWQWLVISLLALSALALMFGVYMFYQVSYGQSQNQNEPSSIQTLSREKLQEVINIYIAKQTEFDSRKSSKPNVPSL